MKLGRGKRDAAPAADTEKVYMTKFGERTEAEIQQSLSAAREARAEKSALLKRIREGEVTLADMFSDAYKNDERVQRLRVGSALRALPDVGPYRGGKIMEQEEISKGRRIRGLGVRQRARLLDIVSK